MTPIRLTYLLVLSLALPAQAETLVAARIIRSQAIIVPADLALIEKSVPGALIPTVIDQNPCARVICACRGT